MSLEEMMRKAKAEAEKPKDVTLPKELPKPKPQMRGEIVVPKYGAIVNYISKWKEDHKEDEWPYEQTLLHNIKKWKGPIQSIAEIIEKILNE